MNESTNRIEKVLNFKTRPIEIKPRVLTGGDTTKLMRDNVNRNVMEAHDILVSLPLFGAYSECANFKLDRESHTRVFHCLTDGTGLLGLLSTIIEDMLDSLQDSVAYAATTGELPYGIPFSMMTTKMGQAIDSVSTYTDDKYGQYSLMPSIKLVHSTFLKMIKIVEYTGDEASVEYTTEFIRKTKRNLSSIVNFNGQVAQSGNFNCIKEELSASLKSLVMDFISLNDAMGTGLNGRKNIDMYGVIDECIAMSNQLELTDNLYYLICSGM